MPNKGVEQPHTDRRGRHGHHVRGRHHHRWNPGPIISSQGYVKIRVGRDHPRADANGYAYEHILVAEEMLGRRLAIDEVVHHRDGNKRNNTPDNLAVVTRTEHAAIHRLGQSLRPKNVVRARDPKTGRFVKTSAFRAGKGTVVDGRTWDEFPQAPAAVPV